MKEETDLDFSSEMMYDKLVDSLHIVSEFVKSHSKELKQFGKMDHKDIIEIAKLLFISHDKNIRVKNMSKMKRG